MTYSLQAQKRSGKDAQDVRAKGLVPGVVYGPDRESASVSVNALELQKIYNEAGESTLIDFTFEGEKMVKVLIQDLQYAPVKGNITHVDFRQIQMGVEMEATVELEYVGMSSAVKELGGTLSVMKDELDVKCLPENLVTSIQVDISVLNSFDDAIHVKDLQLPQGVVSTESLDLLLAKVVAPLSEDEQKAMEAGDATSIEDIEVEEKGKKEEGVVADGKKEDKFAQGGSTSGGKDEKKDSKKGSK
ncbi:MAG: 50S ribosomal protein L25 [Candidatus Magasanikbacteria bacterium CG10_big_fil_rev_8_21_14_0_10_36_16]|uniref:Large ribosomal subunit protein bL25 n=1 Tax=Candidatus Magasanikbacteria bacterium CG10_big_fil_rev_8_21_14_0_10_36_16 TaxID=1974645 RepID=A0A2H0TZA3_9BACT|nr:MAG: 50S ribosomal protein L25 [Candidatus Magasanikbacteria bacterium CG10_big_fil_rev_8_21_14_0_10_36_16]